MRLRLSYARMLVQPGRLDEATTEHAWLWQHMLEHEPSMVGVRLSFFIGDIERLVQTHAPARETFTALRDAVAPEGVDALDTPAFADWMALCRALRENDRVLAWFDAVRAELPVAHTRGSSQTSSQLEADPSTADPRWALSTCVAVPHAPNKSAVSSRNARGRLRMAVRPRLVKI
jgi:hypothetical protein